MLQIKFRGFMGETTIVVRDSSGCLWAGSGLQATSVQGNSSGHQLSRELLLVPCP